MKLLFDETLSHKLVGGLADPFPSSVHVRDIGLKTSDDDVVWEYARKNDLMIVSKDSDMHQRSLVFGYPPKVVWVRLGNCSTSDVEEFTAAESFDHRSLLRGQLRVLPQLILNSKPDPCATNY